MKDNAGCGSRAWASVRLLRKGEVKLIGHLKLFIDGKKILDEFNDVTTAFKNKSAQGAAGGTFSPFTGGKVKLTCSDVSTYDCPVTKLAGGTGAEDYVKYRFTWQNTSGNPKTINTAEFYDVTEVTIYCQKTGLSVVVPDQNTVAGEWTITVTYSSGGVKDLYRNRLAGMLHSGSFLVPNKINFIDTIPANHFVTASLEEGGTGAENYHQWTATYVATGAITIDILALGYLTEAPMDDYTQDDIVDKSLDTSEELIGRVRITHN